MKSSLGLALAFCAALVLSGCAQSPTKSSSEPARARSYSDTLDHVRGRGSLHAPSQLQIGMGQKDSPQHSESQDRALIESRQVRELLEPQTFLGTIPCPLSDPSCQPVRVSITFAPAGVWRLRAQNASATADQSEHFSQGCWYRIGTDPTRIALISTRDTVVGDFSFVHDRQLRIKSFNQYHALLETHLTRQRDIDAISALDEQPAPVCRGLDEDTPEEIDQELIIHEH